MEQVTAAPLLWQAPDGSQQSPHEVTSGNSDPIEQSTSHEKDLENAATSEEKDLEKVVPSTDARSVTTSGHISRLESVTRRNTCADTFSHPLSHVKTAAEYLVGFDGEDDPYRPRNWPFRKKVITTLLYGLTTMGSTWASSV